MAQRPSNARSKPARMPASAPAIAPVPKDPHLAPKRAIASPSTEAMVSSMGLVMQDAGGKVDADAIVALAQRARELGLEADDDEQLRTVRFELQHNLDKRLDKYLTDRITFLSRTQLQKLIDEGGVMVNAKPAKASLKVNAGDVIEVVVPAPPNKDITPEDIPLEVMFEDEHIIVINKQPDIIVHPARSENTGTMLGALAYHFKHRSKAGGGLSSVGKDLARPGVVHRLDRHTSGVIIFAKTEEAHWKLGHQFEHRSVDKRYLALVHGHVEPNVQVIDLPIGPHPSREKGYREKYVVRHDELGKPSVTIVRVRERYVVGGHEREKASVAGHRALAKHLDAQTTTGGAKPEASSISPGWKLPELPSRVEVAAGGPNNNPFQADTQRFTLVELELKTGRTHQIRVHMSHNLWPIVGDDMYGGKVLTMEALGTEHRALAKSRAVRKPAASAKVCVPSPLIARQALHATMLSFEHPITKQPLRFIAPLRGDMAGTVKHLRSVSTQVEEVASEGVTVELLDVVGT